MSDPPARDRRRRAIWGVALGLAGMALFLGAAFGWVGLGFIWAVVVSVGLVLVVPIVLLVQGGLAIAQSPRLPPPRWWWIALTVLVGWPAGFFGPIGARLLSLRGVAFGVPVYPGAQRVAQHATPFDDDDGSARLVVVFQATGPAAAIADFFADTLTARGWLLDTPAPYAADHTYWYRRPGSWVRVDICRRRQGWSCRAAPCEEWSGPKLIAVTVSDRGLPSGQPPRSERCRAKTPP